MVDATAKSEHFWSLVGRMSVVFGLPIAIPVLGAFFWLGSLSTRVDGQEKQMTNLLTVVSGLVTLDAGQTVTLQSNGLEIDRLRSQMDGLIREQMKLQKLQKP